MPKEQVRAHMTKCENCRVIFETYHTGPVELPIKGSPLELVANGYAARHPQPEQSEQRKQVARLFCEGATIESLLEQTELNSDDLLQFVLEARDRRLVVVMIPTENRQS